MSNNSNQSTRDKILDSALRLFSQNSYSSVSVRDIAKNVGIRESSLYHFFKNKQDIYDSVLTFCQDRAEEYFRNLTAPFSDDNINISQDKLIMITVSIVNFYLGNEISKLFGRMLIIGQFSDNRLKIIYRSIYINQPIGFYSMLFSTMAIAGTSPERMAKEFYSPIFMLINSSDSLGEVISEIKEHIITFMKFYSNHRKE